LFPPPVASVSRTRVGLRVGQISPLVFSRPVHAPPALAHVEACFLLEPERAPGQIQSLSWSSAANFRFVRATLPAEVRFGASVVESSRVPGGSPLCSSTTGFPCERERVVVTRYRWLFRIPSPDISSSVQLFRSSSSGSRVF
jgi:hypothetical protein